MMTMPDKGSLVEYKGEQWTVDFIHPETRRAHLTSYADTYEGLKRVRKATAAWTEMKTIKAARFM